MSSGGSGKTQTVTEKSDPWGPQQPYLQQGYQRASDLMNSGGPQYYPGQTLADRSGFQMDAQNAIWQQGVYGNQAMNMLGGVSQGLMQNNAPMVTQQGAQQWLSGQQAQQAGMNAQQAGMGAQQAGLDRFNQGAWGTLGSGMLNELSQGHGGPGMDALMRSAQGMNLNATGPEYNQAGMGYLTGAARGDYLTQNNPYFSQMVENANMAARPSLDAAFASSGRAGSGAHANAFADMATRNAQGLAYQDYGRERGLQDQAAGTLTNIYGRERGMQDQAAGMLSQIQSGAAQGLLGADLQARGLGASMYGQGTGMYNAGTGMYGAGTSAMAGGTNMYNSGLNTYGMAGQLGQMSSDDQWRRLSALQGVGSDMTSYNQAQIDADRQRWDYNQQLPQQNLQDYWGVAGNNIIPGGGTRTSPGASYNPWAASIGGMASGAAMGGMLSGPLGSAMGMSLGPWGALGGAALGLGAGLFR